MTDWYPIDEFARGAMPYVPGVIVWLWRPKTEHAKGYSVVATHLPTRDSEWAYAAGGTPISWTPSHWAHVTGPDSDPGADAGPDELTLLRSIVRKLGAGGRRPEDTHWLVTAPDPVGVTAAEAALFDSITEGAAEDAGATS